MPLATFRDLCISSYRKLLKRCDPSPPPAPEQLAGLSETITYLVETAANRDVLRHAATEAPGSYSGKDISFASWIQSVTKQNKRIRQLSKDFQARKNGASARTIARWKRDAEALLLDGPQPHVEDDHEILGCFDQIKWARGGPGLSDEGPGPKDEERGEWEFGMAWTKEAPAPGSGSPAPGGVDSAQNDVDSGATTAQATSVAEKLCHDIS